MPKKSTLARNRSKQMKDVSGSLRLDRRMAIVQAAKDTRSRYVGKIKGVPYYRARRGISSSGSFFTEEELLSAKKRGFSLRRG